MMENIRRWTIYIKIWYCTVHVLCATETLEICFVYNSTFYVQ